MKHFVLLLICLSFGMIFQSCKKDANPVEPQPVASSSNKISVVIQEPSSDGCYVTVKEKISLSGMAISDNSVKEVRWKSSSNQGTASGLENWTIAEIQLQEGDNVIVVSASDNSERTSSDTIIITRNKYLNFLYQPQFNPANIPVNETANVTVQIEIEPVANLDNASVKLIEVNNAGSTVSETAVLYDDGDLNHGDDIKGDNVFSNIVQMTAKETGVKRFRVTAKTNETTGDVTGKSSVSFLSIYAPVNQTVYEQQQQLQKTAAEKLYNTFYSSKDLKTAVNTTADWLKTQSNVKSVSIEGERLILVNYSSGLTGGVMVKEVDENGKPLYRGGALLRDTSNRKSSPLKLFEQTRGEYTLFPNDDPDTNILFNKNVIVWSPCEEEFIPNTSTEIIKRLNKNRLGLNIKHFAELDATVEVAKTFCNYGLVIMDAHGAKGEYIATKEQATAGRNFLYRDLLNSGQIVIVTDVPVCVYLQVIPLVTYDVYLLTPSFVLNLNKRFAKSIIVNLSCEGAISTYATPTRSFAVAFIKKGASTYLGYTGLTTGLFSYNTAPDFIERLVVDEKSTHDAYVPVETSIPSANKFAIQSAYKIRYTSGLINGNFEYPVVKYGQVVGWYVFGDARVLTKLGEIKPWEGKYMGIVSTGLGFTTSSGEYSQFFRVRENESKLFVRWRFLSEEFLEYIGSKYQDKFKITITDTENGVETVLLEKSVDAIAAQFGATKESPGSLAPVSPDIKFDHGDVYATGWLANAFDVSAYRGKLVRLSISVGDVGDSSYDTAVLLDEISMH